MPDDADQPGRPADSPVVRLHDVHKSFGTQSVFRGLSLEVPAGLATVVLGPSGCGKSVMLKHVIGLMKPDAGEVWFERTRVDTLAEAELNEIRRQFGYLFQQGALFDSMTVEANVAFPLEEHTTLAAAARRRRVEDVLALVGLREVMPKMPADLSGGQRKRVALARAIVLEPRVILYDEPTTGLDPVRADAINDLILKLQRELRVTSIVVTHDLHSAFKVADRMVMLSAGGTVVEVGDRDAFRRSRHPDVRRFLDIGQDDWHGRNGEAEGIEARRHEGTK